MYTGPLEGRSCRAVHGQCVLSQEAEAAERVSGSSAVSISGWESDQLRWAPRCARTGEDPAIMEARRGSKGGANENKRACHCDSGGCQGGRGGQSTG